MQNSVENFRNTFVCCENYCGNMRETIIPTQMWIKITLLVAKSLDCVFKGAAQNLVFFQNQPFVAGLHSLLLVIIEGTKSAVLR